MRKFTCMQNALNELFTAYFAIVISVLTSKEVRYTSTIVLVPIHVSTTPFIKAKVLQSLHLFDRQKKLVFV